MNVNKKLDRLKQWAGEKMGGEAKTSTSDDFKALEMEMALRHEGKAPYVSSSVTIYSSSLLILYRHGKAPKIHDNVCQIAFKAQRSRG